MPWGVNEVDERGVHRGQDVALHLSFTKIVTASSGCRCRALIRIR